MKNSYSDYDIIFGIHPVNEVIRAKKRKIYMAYILQSSRNNEIEKIVSQLPSFCKVFRVARNQLDTIAQTHEHQGIIIMTEHFIFRKKFFNPSQNNVIIAIDRIQDPRNLGAILRSAYCTNIVGAIVVENEMAPLSRSAFKASAGLAEYIDIIKVPSMKQGLEEAQKNGYTIFLAGFGGIPLNTLEINSPSCIVIGNEGLGVASQLYKYGQTISIPQKRNDISFNASVAAGIIMYHFSTRMKCI